MERFLSELYDFKNLYHTHILYQMKSKFLYDIQIRPTLNMPRKKCELPVLKKVSIYSDILFLSIRAKLI